MRTRTRMNQRGAALILLLGITATLAILASTMVFVILNQQRATASSRSSKQSLYAAEAALDSGVQLAKVGHTMSTTAEWLTPDELEAAFAGQFPAGAEVKYRVYDNLKDVNPDVKWDQGGPTAATAHAPDGIMWVEANCTYQKKTTRARMLISQATVPFAQALPAAVTYSDTGIDLQDTSDIYAVNPDGSAYLHVAGTDFPTSISAGGTWTPALDAKGWNEVGRFKSNGTADLAHPDVPGQQSIGIKANGSVVTTGHSFSGVTVAPGTVGYLSDYFDQKAQADLANESQAGQTHAAAPIAPTALTASGDVRGLHAVLPGQPYDRVSHLDRRLLQLHHQDLHVQQRHPDHRRLPRAQVRYPHESYWPVSGRDHLQLQEAVSTERQQPHGDKHG